MSEEYDGGAVQRNGPRPDPIPRDRKTAVLRVVKGAKNLNPLAYKVWEEILWLDRSEDGCYLRPDALAERCGMSKRTCETRRRSLKRFGLVASRPRPAWTDSWFATLAVPLPSAKPTVEEVRHLTAILAHHIANPGESGATKLVVPGAPIQTKSPEPTTSVGSAI